MFTKLIQLIIELSAFSLILTASYSTLAVTRFTSNYPCNDAAKICIQSGTKIIDGFEVYRDCWEYSYQKTCHYPSKDDCKNFAHCYAVADLPCLLLDNDNNCVNLQKEVSCKSWEPVTIDKETVKMGFTEKEGQNKLVCRGVPCMDGNCIDKSYMVDGDMMDCVSKLYAVSQMKGALDLNFKLFAGFAQSCSKKATSYTNCCSTSLKGWGKNLGAKCTKDEIDLVDKRQKNLCVYVGKQNKQTMGITTVVKHHYCCFGSLLNKVIQVEGRKQLGINFGSGGNSNCRGLTLTEIMSLNFDKMDFSEFFADILKRMKIPKVGDISSRVEASLPKTRKYDGNPNNKNNNMTGWSIGMQDNSFEAGDERRIDDEHLKLAQERQRQEAIKTEEERLNKIATLEKAKNEMEQSLISWNKAHVTLTKAAASIAPTRMVMLDESGGLWYSSHGQPQRQNALESHFGSAERLQERSSSIEDVAKYLGSTADYQRWQAARDDFRAKQQRYKNLKNGNH